jgi:hypothetical protein
MKVLHPSLLNSDIPLPQRTHKEFTLSSAALSAILQAAALPK